jgi:hypothetical protein
VRENERTDDDDGVAKERKENEGDRGIEGLGKKILLNGVLVFAMATKRQPPIPSGSPAGMCCFFRR